MPAVALTDTNGLYAAVPFYKAAREAHIQPIVGVVHAPLLDRTFCAAQGVGGAAGMLGASQVVRGALRRGGTDAGTAALVGVAIGAMFPLVLTLPLDMEDRPEQVGAVVGMMLGVGYIIAGSSPFVLGYVRDATGSFTLGLWLIVATGILFVLGVAGFLFRRNIITVFMSIELMLNAVNLTFVAFSYQLKQVNGQIFSLFVMVVAAAESAVGLAIIIAVVGLVLSWILPD